VPASAPPAPGPKIVQLSPGDASCAIDEDGKVWKLQVGTLVADVTVKGARSLSCGMNHCCVIGADEKVYCWGSNAYGALGDGTEKDRSVVGPPVVGLSSVAEIAVEYARACARTKSGDVYCWGDSEFGKAGDGRLPDNVGREKSAPGKPVLAGAASIGVGMAHAFAVMPDGRLQCWGQNNASSCGLPPSTRYAPRPVVVPKSKDALVVRAAESVSCSIDKRGAVACWGSNGGGVLGPNGPKDEAAFSGTPTPTPIPLPAVAAEIVVGSGAHACARLVTGPVHCWGANEHGQLGDGTTKDRRAPAPVKGLPGQVLGLSAGLERTCALVAGGRVFCWGSGTLRPDPSSFPQDSAAPVEVVLPRP